MCNTAERVYLSTKEVAEIFGVGCFTIRSWVRAGRLKAIKLSEHRSGRIRILSSSVHDLMNEMKRGDKV